MNIAAVAAASDDDDNCVHFRIKRNFPLTYAIEFSHLFINLNAYRPNEE